ncbi:MAG: hypothetical protein AB1782_01190 [Cyanobacteriota bacterium]
MRFSTGNKNIVNYNIFLTDSKAVKISEQNPFKVNVNTYRIKDKGSSLIEQLNNDNCKNNAFLAAALKRDPYAVWGITSQIRIA